MFLSRLQPIPEKAAELIASMRHPYQAHQLIWPVFRQDDSDERCFLFRVDESHGIPAFYTLSSEPPADTGGLFKVESKPFAPKLFCGLRLDFSVRVNPVVSRRDASGKSQRHDVVMDEKYRARSEGHELPDLPTLVQRAGKSWLLDRQEKGGFSVESVHADGYQKHTFRKKKATSVTICTLELQGTLSVVEPQAFSSLLYQGLGPAKGFGCGLLLIRPALI